MEILLSSFVFALGIQVGSGAPGAGPLVASLEPELKVVDGWTEIKPAADTRKVYVSATNGKDANDGTSAKSAKRTIAAAVALLRDGHPDWLLLERGGVWHESLGQWKKSGRKSDEPMLIASYGDKEERPLLLTGKDSGIYTHGGGGSPATIDDLALVGIHFRADGHEGGADCVGARFLQPASHVLVEDCMFEGYGVNLVFQGYKGRHHDFRLRRSIIVDAFTVHAVGGHSQGLYADALDGLLLEENFFDHNGWNEKVPGAGADIYSHDVYLDNDLTDVIVRGNIIANASSHGMQLRAGGQALDNLFVSNAIALSVGGGNRPQEAGVAADVRGNVILDGRDIDERTPRGFGLWLANISGGRVAFNVIAANTHGTRACAITLDGRHKGDERASIGVHDLLLEHNVIWEWGGGIEIQGGASQISKIELTGNQIRESRSTEPLVAHDDQACKASIASRGNCFSSKRGPTGTSGASGKPSFPDPERDLAAYDRSIGGEGTVAGFLASCRASSRQHWRPELTAAAVNRYIRAGFGLEFE